MSETETNTVLFSIAQDQASLRLFELPDELTALLLADNAAPLQIKSAEPTVVTGNNNTAASSGGSSGAAINNAFAVLCTADKTYQIRQVQTSNSLYVVQASADAGLTAIATCPATIELSPAPVNKPNTITAQQNLRDLLVEWDGDSQPPPLPRESKSRTAIFDSVPLSTAEIRLAWTDICAFEYENVAYFPSASVSLSAWTTMRNIALAEAGTFDPSATLSKSLRQQAAEETHIPQELYEAICERISLAEAPESAASWLARLLLEADGQAPQSRTKFMSNWTELLSDSWKKDATLDLISSFTDQSDPTAISLKTFAPVVSQKASTATDATASKRKWHERLKKGK